MGTSEQVNRLVALGLTKYEATAYLGLIRRETVTGAELSRLTGVPRQRIYDTLEGLIGKGLASERPDEVTRYASVSPDTAVDLLIAQHRNRLADLERQGEQVAKALRPAFHEGRSQTDPLDYVEVIRYPGAIATRFEELLAGVQQEMLVFSKPPFAFRGDPIGVDAEVVRMGKVRTIYERSVLDDPSLVHGLKQYMALGEMARFVEELPLKLGIIDSTTVMFGMREPLAGEADITTIIIEHSALARLLKIAFETIWSTSSSYEEFVAAHGGGTSA